MNNENIVTNDESLNKMIGTYVAAKLPTGRVISGILLEEDGIYSIKLGVLYIPIDAETLLR